MAEQVEVPLESELAVCNTVNCLHDGCTRVFKSSGSRNMHMIRHHQRKALNNEQTCNKVYYCPVIGCCRSQTDNNKPFKRLGHVKQHYNNVHKEKVYECVKCNRKFGMKDAYDRHMKECGTIFSCQTCDIVVKSYNALYQHCKRTGHTNKERQNQSSSSVTNIILSPLIIKTVLPLPRQQSSTDYSLTEESVTQTELTDYEFLSHDLSHDKDVQTNCLVQCEFGTQTMPLLSDSLPHPYLQSNDDIFDNETIDFGTQTMLTPPKIFQELYNSKDQSSQTHSD